METFLNFLVTNWQYISIGLVVVLDIILILCRKTKVIDNSLTSILVALIKSAEVECADGKAKLNYVLEHIRDYKEFDTLPLWYISNQVEAILATPTKKGGLGREQAIKKKK